MISFLILSAGIALELILLTRGVQQGLFRRYPAFYSYIGFVLASDILVYPVHFYKHVYLYFYWFTEFSGLILGCLALLEFYRAALTAYPGTARMARALLGLLFVVAMIKTVIKTVNVYEWWFYATPVQVQGLLRVCQLLAILLLTVLFLFYSIPFGKNLRGILLGFGLYFSWSVICLALVAAGVADAKSFWSYTIPISYVLTLFVWTTHLWSYQPNPVPDRAIPLEQDYLRVAAATQRRLHTARGHLAKAVGS
jgi:hypothetical protein